MRAGAGALAAEAAESVEAQPCSAQTHQSVAIRGKLRGDLMIVSLLAWPVRRHQRIMSARCDRPTAQPGFRPVIGEPKQGQRPCSRG